jgi:hypothetical protein
MVVNGNIEFVGSNENKLRKAIENMVDNSRLKVAAERTGNEINITYTNQNKQADRINFAFIQPNATTNVKRGENGGRQLTHVNIVRLFKTIKANEGGSLKMQLPPDLQNVPLKLIAFDQKKNLAIGSATEVDIKNQSN